MESKSPRSSTPMGGCIIRSLDMQVWGIRYNWKKLSIPIRHYLTYLLTACGYEIGSGHRILI
jgi:hypothetical protein